MGKAHHRPSGTANRPEHPRPNSTERDRDRALGRAKFRHHGTATIVAVPWSNEIVEAEHLLSSPLGSITISSDAIAHIVGETALECYGVVGMAAKGPVRRLLGRERLTQGIQIGRNGDGGVTIDLHVVVEYGLNLAEVASTIRNRVGYEVGRLTGLPVRAVEVHIEDVRRSE
jgi:uncharacterized alkaline shock family protein YloU